MSEPDWALPMNRTELIAYVEQLKARIEELEEEAIEQQINHEIENDG